MVRTINFIGRQGRYDLPTFLLTDNDVLTLKLTGLDPRLGRYVMTIRHGTDTKTVSLSSAMTLDLPTEWLALNGTKPIEVFLELRDNAGTRVLIPSAKSPTDQAGFYIEPLKLERVDESWSMVAWLQRIESEITAIKLNQSRTATATSKRIKDVEDKLAEYEDKGIPLTFED